VLSLKAAPDRRSRLAANSVRASRFHTRELQARQVLDVLEAAQTGCRVRREQRAASAA
jgi:hypothetical protein